MVVVKRASGVIETRGPVGEQPAAATATAERATAAAEASAAEAPWLRRRLPRRVR